jgi:hypothetical protein
MEKKINVAELLKDCPQGMELDCLMFDNLEFDRIEKYNDEYPIYCRVRTGQDNYHVQTFTEYGYFSKENYCKCVIFPKGKTTWDGFQRPFKDGENDIIKDDMEAITIDDFKANTKEWLIDKLHGMIISDAIKTISNIHDELHKPQYPKTYEECCKVLGYEPDEDEINCYEGQLIEPFVKLLTCRNAYWKIAGEQMGLGNPWKPDWENYNEYKYCLYITENDVNKGIFYNDNHILVFPTEEMRDVFYENFKDLIEKCKEFL